MKQYIVDAFADRPFTGNPAAVCVMDAWPSDEFMKKLAMENSLSETAFLVREGEFWRLRWFTPGTEVELCGHATLASAFVVLNYMEPGGDFVQFTTLSGILTVRRHSEDYEMDFPLSKLKEIPVTDAMEKAFGVRPVRAVLGMDLICVFEREEDVRSMQPDQAQLSQLPGRIQNATARGQETDCVSRSFCPKLAIPEDPVCGSAHCQIADFWSRELGKKEILAYQASRRGGFLKCAIRSGGRISISGKAVLTAVSEIADVSKHEKRKTLKRTCSYDLNDYIPVHTLLSIAEPDGEAALRVVKADKQMQFDENTLVRLRDCAFHDGIIRVRMLSRLLPDAPDFARGFIGIVFRVSDDSSEFESFYIRPTNAMTDDPVRRAHGCQYFSYPGYTFAYFREFGIAKYEAPMAYGLDQWVQLTAVIRGASAEFYLGDDPEPVLRVHDLKHGADARGSVGFFSEIGTEAFFRDLEIEFFD